MIRYALADIVEDSGKLFFFLFYGTESIAVEIRIVASLL